MSTTEITIPVPAPSVRNAGLDEVIRNRVAGLARNVQRHNRWFRYCDAESLARQNGTVNTVKRPSLPSKAAKHRAYDDSRAIQRYLGLNCPDGILGTRAEWTWTVEQARAAGL